MPKVLSEDQIDFFRETGFLSPYDGIDPTAAAAMCADLAAFEQSEGMCAGDINMKGHLCFSRAYEITANDQVLDVVEDLIGPNILAFASRFWVKKGNHGKFVSWHQDSAYFGLEPHDLVTAWVALTASTEEMGCMKVLPGSHLGETHSHTETFAKDNLLARGQVISGIDESKAVSMPLKVGQFSCHHERIVHGSEANSTPNDRIGMAIFYIPTHVKSTIGRRTACLVRGVDDYGYWDADPLPKAPLDRDILDHTLAASQRYVDPQYIQEAEA